MTTAKAATKASTQRWPSTPNAEARAAATARSPSAVRLSMLSLGAGDGQLAAKAETKPIAAALKVVGVE